MEDLQTAPLRGGPGRRVALARPSIDLPRIPEVGDVIADKYRVESILGRGGMGVVLAARHMQLGERVAIKVMLLDVSSRGAFAARFLREARITAQLRNDHVTRVTDFGTLASGTPYMVMDLVEGQDLREVLNERGKLPVHVAAEYVVQVCEGLAEAHGNLIIHRDIKPPNLFLTHRADGTELLKILDFGISKQLEWICGDLTDTGVSMGSPRYMSPEQFANARDLDARADIWALGAILYELTTGAPAFDEPTPAALCARIIGGKPPAPMRERRPDIPEEIEAAVMSCLSYERADRPRDVAELASRILSAIGASNEEARTASIRATLGCKALSGAQARRPSAWPLRAEAPLASIAGASIAGASVTGTTQTECKALAQSPSQSASHGLYGEALIPLPMARDAVPPVLQWRSTWITSALQTLRERGLFDRYVDALPPELKTTLPFTVPGLWVPVATARAHYDACDRLGLSRAEARDLGLAIGERAQGMILRTGVLLAKGVGVDSWSVMNQVPRIWARGAQGGAVAVYKAGPKEGVLEILGCELFDLAYFRAAFHGVVLGVLRLVAQRAYAQEKAGGATSSTFTLRLQWV